MRIWDVIWVAIGGAIGSSLRFIVSYAVQVVSRGSFPWGTFTVNVIGCFAIGVLAARLALPHRGDFLRPCLMIGLLGGFTTFSSYALETVNLAEGSPFGSALLNVALSNIIGIAMAFGGYRLGVWVFSS